MRLVDFTALDSPRDWYSVTDGLMGGLSRAQLTSSPEGYGLFTGHVSLAHGGGFASVYLDIPSRDLSAFVGIELEISAPERPYKVNLKDVSCGDTHVYQAALGDIVDEQHQWQKYRLPFTEFAAVRRGLSVMGPVLDLQHVCAIALVAAGRRQGDFNLLIRSIGLYRD